jgi:hypothetical protein
MDKKKYSFNDLVLALPQFNTQLNEARDAGTMVNFREGYEGNSYADVLIKSFTWRHTEQGELFWTRVHVKLQDGILP